MTWRMCCPSYGRHPPCCSDGAHVGAEAHWCPEGQGLCLDGHSTLPTCASQSDTVWAMRLPWWRDVRRFGSSGATELALASVLFGLEIPVALMDWRPLRFALSAALFVAAAISGVKTQASAAITCAAMLLVWLLTPRDVGAALYAPLVTVLGCVIRRHYRWAALVSLCGLAVSVALSWLWTQNQLEGLLAVLMWAGVYAVPWVLGMGLRRERENDRADLLAELELQRREIASELHDNLAHDLALIVLHSEKELLQGSGDGENLGIVVSAARRSGSHLRNLMNLLSVSSPNALLGLEQVWIECVSALRAANFEPDVEVLGDVRGIRPAVGDALARVAREATNNIVRHGDPQGTCDLSLRISPDLTHMSFTNTTAHPEGAWRLGLSGIRDRINAINGTMDVTNDAGTWKLTLSAPLR